MLLKYCLPLFWTFIFLYAIFELLWVLPRKKHCTWRRPGALFAPSKAHPNNIRQVIDYFYHLIFIVIYSYQIRKSSHLRKLSRSDFIVIIFVRLFVQRKMQINQRYWVCIFSDQRWSLRIKMAAEQKKSGCKLFVRHLPSILSNADKIDLLKHFGAKDVICMGRSSKMVSERFDFLMCKTWLPLLLPQPINQLAQIAESSSVDF